MIWRHIQLNLMLLFFPNITCDHFMIKKINFYGTPSSSKHDLHPQLPAYFFIFFYLQQLSPASELATNWWTEARVCWDERGEILRRRIPKETWGVGDWGWGIPQPFWAAKNKERVRISFTKKPKWKSGKIFYHQTLSDSIPDYVPVDGNTIGSGLGTQLNIVLMNTFASPIRWLLI
jgi:hypothetical protein